MKKVALYIGSEVLGEATVTPMLTGDKSGQWGWTYDWQPNEHGDQSVRAVAVDGANNEGDATIQVTVGDYWYRDADADLFGNPNESVTAGTQPIGYVADSSDCDDTSSFINPGAPDTPDLSFVDSNCDGIDGDKSLAIFVSPSGSDENPGTLEAPTNSLSAALAAAHSAGKAHVYAATGSYSEDDGLKLATGISIFGGYDPTDWSRSILNDTQVTATTQGALADGATNVTLQLIIIRAERGSGLSVYGVRAVNGADLTLEAVTVIVSDARPGAAGTTGNDGQQGSGGSPGIRGHVDQETAGSGGAAGSGPGYAGGPGGNGGSGASNGQSGSNGLGPLSGSGGAAGRQNGCSKGGDGGPGGNGAPGANGLHGVGGTNSLTHATATWVGSSGTAGTNGAPGNGGGGGGGGAGQGGFFCNAGAGSGGGGGGAGGSGGTYGTPGTAGGGSFGIYAWNSTISVSAGSNIKTGTGGAGGSGGSGGAGGSGGSGGAGGNCCETEVGKGGQGGNGGAGGDGGSGGGGAGGPSIGIFLAGSSSANAADDTTYTIGAPASGGTSPGNSGASGQTGTMLAQP